MLYRLVLLFTLLMAAARANTLFDFKCGNGFSNQLKAWDSTCNTAPDINIDVITVVSGAPGSFDPGNPATWKRELCFEKNVTGILRVTPAAGQSVGEVAILWGNAPNPVPVAVGPCPPALDLGGSKCGVPTNKYALPGDYPAAIFATNSHGKIFQVEGFISTQRCTPFVNLDLGLLATKERVTVTPNASPLGDLVSPKPQHAPNPPSPIGADNFREICAGKTAVALVRATVGEGMVQSDVEVRLWTSVVNSTTGQLITQPIAADGLLHAVDVSSFTGTGNYPVAMFAKELATGRELQLEALVYSQNCP